jgi:hypothetical protein
MKSYARYLQSKRPLDSMPMQVLVGLRFQVPTRNITKELGIQRELQHVKLNQLMTHILQIICITIINGMQGVDRRTYNAALDLFQNPCWRKNIHVIEK